MVIFAGKLHRIEKSSSDAVGLLARVIFFLLSGGGGLRITLLLAFRGFTRL